MATIRGGEKFEAALREIANKLGKKGTVKVGFFAEATYPDKNSTPVAMVAAIQNYGAPKVGIPPRPFFSNMVSDKSSGWPAAVAKSLKATNYDTALTLKQLGEGIAGQLLQSINDTNAPPLSPRTIQAKGFAKPLVDTGHMLNSIDYKVKT